MDALVEWFLIGLMLGIVVKLIIREAKKVY